MEEQAGVKSRSKEQEKGAGVRSRSKEQE